MKIITEEHGGNWWHNVRIWGGQEMTVPDTLGQDLIDRGLAKKAEKAAEKKVEKEEHKETKMEEYKSKQISAKINKGGKFAD